MTWGAMLKMTNGGVSFAFDIPAIVERRFCVFFCGFGLRG
jgi:hypothetical protein